MSEQRNSLRLGEARELTPPVNAVEAMRRQLSVALFGGVKEQDVVDMANKLKEMAQGGDLKAMKMYFDLVLGKDAKPTPPPPPPAVGIAEALRDLVDEIRIAKHHSRRKVEAINGNGGPHDEDDDD